MADMAEPPAKRARLDMDAPDNGTLLLDAPGSPIDDLDDDFYETAPVEATSSAIDLGGLPSSAVTAEPTGIASSQIPGLGLWSTPAAAQASLQVAPSLPGAEGLEDGELSDDESFYSEVKPGVSVTPNLSATGPVPQQSKLPHPGCHSAFSPTVDGQDSSVLTTLPVPGGMLSTSLQPQGSFRAEAHDTTNAPVAAVTTTTQEDEGKAEFLHAAAANRDDKEAEWQLDSEASDTDSDSSSASSSGDSSSDEDGESDGELLSPEEAIKRMMAEDPDDAEPAAGAKVKTQNETDEVFEKPDIKMQDDTKITELGKVESVVENMVVVKGNTSGNYKVLESGSALCLTNRTVIGQVSEAIGRVQDPRYSVGFTDPTEIETLGITKGTPIYYVNDHSTFVFTEPLRTEKHTDASGQYDEEARNQEFSDDEQEAAHKREQKRERQIKRGDVPADNTVQAPRGPSLDNDLGGRPQPTAYHGGALKYSDDDDDEDLGMYKPLARPDRFEEVVGHGAPIEDRSHVRRGMMRGGRGGWQDRGRGFRGRGGRGDRGGMNHSGRGDRGGMNHGGRGDRGDRSSRGHADRGGGSFRGHPDRGDRSSRGQSDRGRHQEQQRGRGGAQRDNHNNRRVAHSPVAASPPRQNQGHQLQQSPARGKKNRKRNRNSSEVRSSQPPGAANANANAHASNNAQNKPAWSAASAYTSSTTTPAPAVSTAPAYAPAPYINPAFYPQQAAPVADQAQWAQWYQLAQAISQAQVTQQQAVQPSQQPHTQQPQAQYQYPFQYQQNATPTANPQQTSSQPVGSSLSDILRALGNANQGS
jgi:H/ACA ribonucleoprotein complex non-core subunit NAF1